MKTPILFIFVVTAAFLVSVNSCTKTITQIKEVDSTIRDTVHDTAHDTAGLAMMRFFSMFPDDVTQILKFSTTLDGTNVAFSVTNSVSAAYFPVSPNTSTTYYIYGATDYYGSVSIPAPAPGSITTWALFDNGPNNVYASRANDSAKTTPPPVGYCYFRFTNGVGDYPNPPQVYVYLDGADTSIFRSGRIDKPISYTDISQYVLIPSGHHLVFLRGDTTGTALYTNSEVFQDGFYYTAHITGSQSNNDVKFRIDQE